MVIIVAVQQDPGKFASLEVFYQTLGHVLFCSLESQPHPNTLFSSASS